MANFLLDTNALIWLALGVKTGPIVKKLISKQDNNIYLSAISVFELRIKQSSGKLLAADKVIEAINTMGISILPLTPENLSNYRIFSNQNKDPFDNALISVAISEGLIFITADRDLLRLKDKGLKTIDATK